MAHLVNCLLGKHEDLTLCPQQPRKTNMWSLPLPLVLGTERQECPLVAGQAGEWMTSGANLASAACTNLTHTTPTALKLPVISL